MDVYFYTISKKRNSTMRPSGNGAVKACTLKYGTSIQRPVIILEGTITGYNYARIPALGRYYFVDTITINNGFTEYSLVCDVLATYKDDIAEKTCYVQRSSSQIDNTIGDSFYPIKAGYTVYQGVHDSPFLHYPGAVVPDTRRDGVFVIGVVSKTGAFGSIDYRILEYSALNTLCGALLDDSLISGQIDLQDGSLMLQKSILNPIQYIVSCTWVPFLYADFADTDYVPYTTLTVWDWQISVNNKRISDTAIKNIGFGITLQSHPLARDYGNWLNCQPYTRTWLDFPVFGVIPLESEIFMNSVSIDFNLTVDLITGRGKLTIHNGGVTAATLYALIGVPIQLSQVTRDYLGAVKTAADSVGGITKHALKGDIGGAIAEGIGGAAGVAGALVPSVSSVGSGGGFGALYGNVKVFRLFHNVAIDQTAVSLHGLALCQSVQLGTLSGYIETSDGIALAALETERQEVNNYLMNGFFME